MMTKQTDGMCWPSTQPDDNGNQIGQAKQSVAIAFGHSLKIRATKLTCEWIFSSKTETL